MVAVRAKTRIVFNKAELDAVMNGAVKRDLSTRTRRVATQARRLAPRGRSTRAGHTPGRLRRAIKWDVDGERGRWVGRVYVDDSIARSPEGFAYGLAVHEGTGVYGPYRRVIRPTSATFMVWHSESTGRLIRRRTVRGQRPQRFLKNALPVAARD